MARWEARGKAIWEAGAAERHRAYKERLKAAKQSRREARRLETIAAIRKSLKELLEKQNG